MFELVVDATTLNTLIVENVIEATIVLVELSIGARSSSRNSDPAGNGAEAGVPALWVDAGSSSRQGIDGHRGHGIPFWGMMACLPR